MALYNNGYPATYQPMYYQPAPQNQNGIIWVQGEAGAKSYLVAPNNTVQLWDSERQTIYLKSADASGMPNMKVLDYTVRETGSNGVSKAVAPQVDKMEGYATKDDLRAVSEEMAALRKQVERMEDRKRESRNDERKSDPAV